MCYSATASFAVGSALVGGGSYLFRKREIPSGGKLIAAIPYIFAFHQMTEGIVWLGMQGKVPNTLYLSSVYVFAFIANAFWPTYFPLAMVIYEKKSLFRKINIAAFIVGFLGSCYMFWCFTINDFVVAEAGCHGGKCGSLAYNFDIPYMVQSGPYLYLAVILIPMLATQNRRIRYFLAPAFFITFFVANYLSSYETFPSVWCFFAAIISFIFLLVFPSPVGDR